MTASVSWLVGEPAALSIDLQTLKAHCRIVGDDEDALLQMYADAAVEQIERDTRLAIRQVTRSLTMPLDGSRPVEIELPKGPYLSATVTAIFGDDEEVIDAGDIIHDGGVPGWLAIYGIPDGAEYLRVSYVAGYASLPPVVKLLIFQLAAHWNEHREAVGADGRPGEIPLQFAHILRSLDTLSDGVR